MLEFAPDLGALAAALMLLLLAAALGLLASLLANTLGHAPVIGSWVSGNLVGWLTDAQNAVLNASKASWHAAVVMFDWMKQIIVDASDTAFSLFVDASLAVYRIAYVRLPELLAQAESYGLSVYDSAVSYADSLYNRAVAYASAGITAAEAYALTVYDSAVSYAAQLVAAAEARAQALVDSAAAGLANDIALSSTALRAEIDTIDGQLVAGIDGLAASTQAAVNQLAGDIVSGVATAEAVAASQLAAVRAGIYTDLDTWGIQAVTDAWPDAAGDIGALRDTLGADFPWLSDLTGALAGAGTAGLLGALVRSLAGAHAVTRLASDCIVPNCRNLSGLGNDLSQLAQLFSDGAIFAWLAEGVTDPAAFASDVNAVLAPVGNATITTARGVFGGK